MSSPDPYAGPLIEILFRFGFPSAIAIYVLWRLEGKLDALRQEIHNLVVTIARQSRDANP